MPMLRKFIIVLLFCLAVNAALPVYSQQGGYSTGAYSKLEADDSYFNRVSDWFATLGKTEDEKALIKSRRRAARRMIKNQEAIAHKKNEIIKKKKQALEKIKAKNRDSE